MTGWRDVQISLGAYVVKKSPVGILWSKQATSLDILFEP